MPILATVTMPSVTGIVDDNIVNDFAIRNVSSGDAIGVLDDVFAAIENFYNTPVAPAATPIAGFIGDSVSRAQPTVVRFYDIGLFLDGSPHGSPFYSNNFVLDGNIGTDLPAEVAAVITIEGVGYAASPVEAGATRPKQRRAGRVYLGPLTSTVVGTIGGVPRLSDDFVEQMLDTIEALNTELFAIDPVPAAGPASLGQWSRADAVIRQVEAFSVANDFDTQRRRGPKASVRARRIV